MKYLFLLIIAVSFTACVAGKDPILKPVGLTDNMSAEAVSSWNPDAYLYSEPEDADFAVLEEYRNSDNHSLAAEASLVLGYYYLKYGHLETADSLISAAYTSPFLSPYMQRIGELLYLEIFINRDNPVAAGMRAEEIMRTLGDIPTERALNTYCYITELEPENTAEPYSCVEQRLSSITASEYLTGTLNILVVSRQDVASAIMYYAAEHNMRHKIRIEKAFVEGDWDFIIDINSGYLSGRGYSIAFEPDISGQLADMEYSAGLSTCGRVVIGSGMGLDAAADELVLRLLDAGNLVIQVDIADSRSANAGMRDNLTEWELEGYCALGAGTEDEINNFVPVLRQYGTSQRIFALETIDTGKHYNTAYLPYYKEVVVFPAVDLTLSAHVKEFAAEYMDMTGRKLTYEAMLGYDMMQYIYKSTEDGKDYDAPYLSNIIGVEEGKVVRPVKAFFIGADGEIEELVLESAEAGEL